MKEAIVFRNSWKADPVSNMAEKEKKELIIGPRFNIFEKFEQDKSVMACNIIEYHPLSQLSVSASVIEFCVSGDGQSYLDTSKILL